MSPSDPPHDAGWMETWKEHASAFDRVKSVTMTLSEPRSAPWIAEQAAVSPNTARDHLRRLVDLGVVAESDDSGTRHYYPDPLYTRLRDIRELLEGTTKQELSEQAAVLKDDIAAWKTEYDADTPDTLRERAAAEPVSAERAYELTQAASDWELARYHLSLVQDAITNYDTWSADQSSLTV
ncbi:winged helix-turn-helix domain-containing protein [Halorubrum xinjiangense]|uniref:winged helix-turn-helix domain-containing protein n=1 Tax=Halorubrum xinjiangense TaxID=261291 RepID=UPI00165EFCD3|nr:winged helix-turn-helix domain-containing protein [Halorubrum xinjiangense]